MSLNSKLASLVGIAQKDKGVAYCEVLRQLLSQTPTSGSEITTLISTVVSQDHVGLVAARQVLAELVKALDGTPFKGDEALSRQVITGALDSIQRSVSFQDQATSLRLKLADLQEAEEEWSEAARTLMGLNLDSGPMAENEQKLKIYVRIVRLLLEDEDSVQAETYLNRAGLLINSTNDRELQLAYKLCQARINDYARKFVEAALRYHELSWVADLDEEERLQTLRVLRHSKVRDPNWLFRSAAITCAVLAPAGPNRSRILASLSRDERSAQLPNYTILSKMFLQHILRPSEVKGFEETLKPHQLARIAQSSNDRVAAREDDSGVVAEEGEILSKRTGPSTVLDRAVMEHNLLSCSKIYNNITFNGLGALLDLAPGAAETMARRMIEQGRLRGSIDQVARLITFETRDDEEAQGKAGGLGDVNLETEDTGAPLTKKWDRQIRRTAANAENIVQTLHEKGLISSTVAMTA